MESSAGSEIAENGQNLDSIRFNLNGIESKDRASARRSAEPGDPTNVDRPPHRCVRCRSGLFPCAASTASYGRQQRHGSTLDAPCPTPLWRVEHDIRDHRESWKASDRRALCRRCTCRSFTWVEICTEKSSSRRHSSGIGLAVSPQLSGPLGDSTRREMPLEPMNFDRRKGVTR